MNQATISVTKRPSKEEREAVANGLHAYNLSAYGKLGGGERWLLARDAAGVIVGGARCDRAWGWLYVEWLWVAEGLRRQRLGTRLLAAAEDLAREEGCRGLHLHTWSFQAPAFYRKRGFEECGRAEDMPPGATRYWFRKPFPD